VSYPADWRITSRCTLACDFCYGPVPGKDPVDLRPLIARNLVESSADVVTFCGGEPLLVKEVGQYAADMRRAGKQTVLNTNGQLLRRRLDEGMPLAFDVVGLSLDGSSEAMHRKMRGDRADFYAVLDAASVVSSSGVTLKMATVISSVNRDDIVSMAELIIQLNPDIWRLYQYVPIGAYNRGRDRHEIPEEDFLEIAEAVKTAVAPLPVFASTASTQGPGCLIVSMDGAVFHAAPDGDIVHGNCLDRPLDTIWKEIESSRLGQVIVRNKGWHDLVLQGSLVP
jgi:MoaA/NifB/PqqE/SkfB family radical SAM enzyme